jgi:hypothetical protein
MQPDHYPGQYPAQPPKKKKGNGCLIALAITGGVVLVGGILVGTCAYKAATSKEGRQIIGAMGETAKIMEEAQKAPGAKELRASGCATAMVMDMERMAGAFSGLVDGGIPPPKDKDVKVMIMCQVGVFGSAPTCDAVAKTYLSAVGGTASGRFTAQVTQQGNNRPKCSKTFDASGAPIGSE